MFILIVTWFYYGQPPVNSQTQFSTTERCEAARQAIYQEASRLKDEAIASATASAIAAGRAGMITLQSNPLFPTVSAACAQQ
jgi:hypothetical protein